MCHLSLYVVHNMEGTGFMTLMASSLQEATKMLWLHFYPSLFYSQWIRHVFRFGSNLLTLLKRQHILKLKFTQRSVNLSPWTYTHSPTNTSITSDKLNILSWQYLLSHPHTFPLAHAACWALLATFKWRHCHFCNSQHLKWCLFIHNPRAAKELGGFWGSDRR